MLPSAGDNDEPTGEDYGYTTAAIESRGGCKRRKISEAELLLREAGSIFASGADQGAATDEEEEEEEEEEEGGKEAKAHGEKVKKALVGAKLATPNAGGGDTGRALVGRRVSKVFKGEMYGGTVAAFDAKVRWYRVDYDDGDVEEVSISELRAILLQ
ncbi:tudor domain-containing protein [Pseudoscourfieldia marina]